MAGAGDIFAVPDMQNLRLLGLGGNGNGMGRR